MPYCPSTHQSTSGANHGPVPETRNVRPCAFCGSDLQDPPFHLYKVDDVCSFKCAWAQIVRRDAALVIAEAAA